MPTSPEWICETFEITGDEVDENGEWRKEMVHLCRKNLVECIKELIGNPQFCDKIQYTPEKVYANEDMTNQIYDKMWTGDWWWNMQV